MSALDMFPETRVDPGEFPNDRYTLEWTLDWAKKIVGVKKFDLDVAACAAAHCAEKYYTFADDGLSEPWFGHVWCNPPYDNLEAWVKKAWRVWIANPVKSIAMFPPGDRCEQPWWQDWVEPFRDGRGVGHRVEDSTGREIRRVELTTHHPPGRQSFGHPGNPKGVGVQSAPFPNVLLVWRST